MINHLNLPALEDALEEAEFFERERTDPFAVELAIVLYDSGVSLRKIQRVLGWLGVDRSHVAVWNWLQKFGQGLSATGWRPVAELPATILLDETILTQRGEQFVLFAALDPNTREVVHLGVAPSRNYLTTRRFLEEIDAIYGTLPETVITDVWADPEPTEDGSGSATSSSLTTCETASNAASKNSNVGSTPSTPPSSARASHQLKIGFGSSPGSGTTAYLNTA